MDISSQQFSLNCWFTLSVVYMLLLPLHSFCILLSFYLFFPFPDSLFLLFCCFWCFFFPFCPFCTISLLPLHGSSLSPKVSYFPLPMLCLHCNLLKDNRYVQSPIPDWGFHAQHTLSPAYYSSLYYKMCWSFEMGTLLIRKAILIDCSLQNIR